uniref:Uncharacterized protein n=1 Tax=Anguilla anguilla TaxID=7936 RepID=A0A0E9UJE3_ANGAN
MMRFDSKTRTRLGNPAAASDNSIRKAIMFSFNAYDSRQSIKGHR